MRIKLNELRWKLAKWIWSGESCNCEHMAGRWYCPVHENVRPDI